MRLGIEAGPHTVAAARELGIKGVPVDAGDLVAKGAAAVVDPLRAQGLEVCQIGAFGYNPLHPDAAHLARQTELVEKAIDLAPAAGCHYVVINGGNLHASGFGHGFAENFTDQSLERVATGLAPLAKRAESNGVYLCVEPYLKTAVCSAERFLKLAEQVGSPALRINIDVTNFL